MSLDVAAVLSSRISAGDGVTADCIDTAVAASHGIDDGVFASPES